MKRLFLSAPVIAVISAFLPLQAQAASDWIIDLQPGVVFINANANAFSIENASLKESMSMVSSMPNIGFGISVEQPEGYFDFKVGTGVLLNSRLSSMFYFASVGYSYEVRPSILFGPHFSYSSYAAPSWWGDGEIEFSGTSGMDLGVHLIMGDKIAYAFSLDYANCVFDVDGTSNGWTVSKNEDQLDMSGIVISFGFRTRF